MEITGRTTIYGLFGDPVMHSVSPALHNKAFASLGLDCCYLPFRVAEENLERAVASIRSLQLGGVNVTIPHKERVIPYLDRIEESARAIGAVNTIVNSNGVLVGYNTDAAGFIRSLSEAGYQPRGESAVVLGAGGAARAVVLALANNGLKRLWIWNRHPERAELLAGEIAAVTDCLVSVGMPDQRELSSGVTLLVNATPVGMYPHQDQVPILVEEILGSGLLVYDLIYNPVETKLLRVASASGCQVINGIGMLTWQGALAFELWIGQQAPVEVMRSAVEEALCQVY